MKLGQVYSVSLPSLIVGTLIKAILKKCEVNADGNMAHSPGVRTDVNYIKKPNRKSIIDRVCIQNEIYNWTLTVRPEPRPVFDLNVLIC